MWSLFEYSQFIIILKKGKSHVFDFIVILLKAAIRGSVHCGRWERDGTAWSSGSLWNSHDKWIFSCSWTRIVKCFLLVSVKMNLWVMLFIRKYILFEELHLQKKQGGVTMATRTTVFEKIWQAVHFNPNHHTVLSPTQSFLMFKFDATRHL